MINKGESRHSLKFRLCPFSFILLNFDMKEIQVYGAVFVLSLVACVVIFFFRFVGDGSGIDFFPGRSNGGGGLAVALLLGCIVGGINGFLVGVLSILYLGFLKIAFGDLKIAILATVMFSSIVGILEMFFFLRQVSNQYETYGSLLQANLTGLAADFITGFLTAFIPLIIAKIYFKH